MSIKLPITQTGYNKIANELEELKNIDRPNIIKAIEQARAHGDLSENTEYHAAREQQRFIERKINTLETQLSSSEIIKFTNTKSKKISFGATVCLEIMPKSNDESISYTIVGKYESDIKQNTISFLSPIAKGILGKEENDVVEINLPNGLTKTYKILSVQYSNI